jgi:hypothetical protein
MLLDTPRNRRLEDLKLIREALGWVVSEWVDGNMSDKELEDGTAEVEQLRDQLRELMDRFEAMKLATLRRPWHRGRPT